MCRLRVLAFLPFAVAGCSNDDEPVEVASTCAPPGRIVGDRCIQPGVQDNGCAAGTLAVEDGSCQAAGIPPGACAPGFAHDGDVGCTAILPVDPCPPGAMAVPGDRQCRPVMACSAEKWGRIVVDASTEHVDASYAGVVSDGSAGQPWKTIGEAYDAAEPGALIAIAQGSYAEDVVVEEKPVRIEGVCPDYVEIVGTGVELGAINIYPAANGTEVRGVAARGGGLGIALSGSEDVVVDRVWVHHTTRHGINAESVFGATSIVVTDSLIEESHNLGLRVSDALGTLDGLHVRLTQPTGGKSGGGVAIQPSCSGEVCIYGTPATVTLRRSFIERNHDYGVQVFGSVATIEGVVVRGTRPQPEGSLRGRGVNIQIPCSDVACESSERSVVTLRGSLIEDNHEIGMLVMGSDAIIDTTVVRATQPRADGTGGHGITVQVPCVGEVCDSTAPATATLTRSLIEQNHNMGLFVGGSTAVVEAVAFRDQLPQPSNQAYGRAVNMQACGPVQGCAPVRPGMLTMRASVAERNQDVGIYISSSEATLEGTLVHSTVPRAADGAFGDGFSLFSDFAPASVTMRGTRIQDSARAGLSNFGGFAALEGTAIQCAGFDLEGESYYGGAFTFEDIGGNACGCPTAVAECIAVSAGLEPPGASP